MFRRTGTSFLALAILLPAAAASAQTRRVNSRVAPPTFAWNDPGGSFAVTHNPSTLGFLPGVRLDYIHADGGNDFSFVERGDAGCVAAPLFLGIAAGICIESIRPAGSGGLDDRAAGSLAFAYAPNRKLGFGMTLRYVGSRVDDLHGLLTFDLAASYRPSSYLAFTLVASDLNGALDVTGVGTPIPTTFVLASALRPFGNHALTLELAGSMDTDLQFGGRATIAVRIPRLGEVRVAGEIYEAADEELDYRVITGFGVDWGQLSAQGGVLIGDGFDEDTGWYVGASYSATRAEGLPTRGYYRDLEVRGGVGERRILTLTTELDRLRHDPDARGVFLRFRDAAFGMAYAQEIRMAIEALESDGKPVVCHLDAGTGSQLYACAVASRTYLDPAGSMQLMGPSNTVMLIGDLLRNIGIRADFLRIGTFKSATEQFTNGSMSDSGREAREAMLDDVYRRLVHDLANDLERPPEQVRDLIDNGPYVAEGADEADLIDGLKDEYDMSEELESAFGGSYRRVRTPAPRTPPHWSTPRRIGVVVIDGNIVDGDNENVPLIGIQTSGSRTIVRAIDGLAADPSIAAIVLRVDSPGGSALASDQIWRAVQRARARKPVIASMGAVAASGGYYVASATQEIWADPSTITGSIGILYGKVDVVPLAERIGLSLETLQRGRRAGADSIYRPFTGDERAQLALMLRHWYRLFLRRVAEGRDMTMTEIDAVARGRIWSGDRARENGLVDHLGGFLPALTRARELADLGPRSEVVIVPTRPTTLLDYVIEAVRPSDRSAEAIDPDANPANRRLRARETNIDAAPPGVELPPLLRAAAGLAYTVAQCEGGVGLALMPSYVTPVE